MSKYSNLNYWPVENLKSYKSLSEDALDRPGNEQLESMSTLQVYWKCPGCDFPHLTEQQAINCCPPVQVFVCPGQCGGFRYSEQEARECCE